MQSKITFVICGMILSLSSCKTTKGSSLSRGSSIEVDGNSLGENDAALLYRMKSISKKPKSINTVSINIRGKAVEMEEREGFAVLDDMIFGEKHDLDQRSFDSENRTSIVNNIWPGNLIPYVVDESFTRIELLNQAIDHWNKNTTVRFYPRKGNETPYVMIVNGEACNSFIGRQNSAFQIITLGDNCLFHQAIHELGHAAGLTHEQSRLDREEFIKIADKSQIIPTAVNNFNTIPSNVLLAFDFDSRMLYRPTDFLAEDASVKYVLTKLDGTVWTPNITKLSDSDIEAVGEMYGYLKKPRVPRNTIESARNCLTVNQDEFASGTKVLLKKCPDKLEVEYKWLKMPDRTIRGVGGKCLELTSGSTLKLNLCNSTNKSQQWTLKIDGRIISNTGKCMTLTTASSSPSLAFTLCDDLDPLQKWLIKELAETRKPPSIP